MSLPAKLRAAGLKFSEDDSNWLRGGFEMPDGRMQGFYLMKEPDDIFGHSEYDFLSVVGPSGNAADVKKACEIAARSKRGAIIVDSDDTICVRMEIPVNLDGPAALEHVKLCCFVADEMEKEIFGHDKF